MVPDVGHTVGVKRGTAIRHLVEMAEVATEQLRLGRTPIGWPLTEMWVAGALLESSDEIDHGTIVLMIDLPPDELPWLAAHPTAEWVGEQLRLGKRPMLWSYRPAAWPAWTYRNQRVARFWSASNGIESGLIDELRSGVVSGLVDPDRAELVEQVGVELEVSKAHLRSILAQYWDHAWRRNNRSHTSPEDQLWRAATAVTELEDALTEFGRSRAASTTRSSELGPIAQGPCALHFGVIFRSWLGAAPGTNPVVSPVPEAALRRTVVSATECPDVHSRSIAGCSRSTESSRWDSWPVAQTTVAVREDRPLSRSC